MIATLIYQPPASAQPAPTGAVELCLLVDVTGSTRGITTNLDDQSLRIANFLSAADSASFGLATVKDYPVNPHGDPGDYPYRLETPLTDVAGWQGAIGALPASNGGRDGPESLLDAVWGTVNGLDPWGDPCGFTAEVGTTRILITTTDNGCHLPGGGRPHVYSQAEVADTLVANGITFVGLDGGGSSPGRACFQPLIEATGGTAARLNGNGSNIGNAIESALFDIFGGPLNPDCSGDVSTAAPEDNRVIFLRNAATCRYLDGDGVQRAWNVDTSPEALWDAGWRLEDNGDGSWSLLNRRRTRYLDADGAFFGWNVGQSVEVRDDDRWDFVDNGDGTFGLRNVANGRYLAQTSMTDKNVVTVAAGDEPIARWLVQPASRGAAAAASSSTGGSNN